MIKVKIQMIRALILTIRLMETTQDQILPKTNYSSKLDSCRKIAQKMGKKMSQVHNYIAV